MDINATIIGQMITFAVFVWFTVKFVWPPMTRAMEDRRKKIADGLSAAEQGQKELEQAKVTVAERIQEAKEAAAQILEQANQRSTHIVEEAKQQARTEGQRLLQLAQSDIEQSYNRVKTELTQQVTEIAIAGAKKILEREVDKAENDRLIERLLNEVTTQGG